MFLDVIFYLPSQVVFRFDKNLFFFWSNIFKMKYRFLLFVPIQFCTICYAQIRQEIRGKVANKESKTVLTGASIQLLNGTIGAVSLL
jgi:hypothetical protein